MLTVAIILFVISALGGLVLVTKVLREEFAPWSWSILHGLIGGAGLLLLLVGVLQGTGGGLGVAALVLFAIVAAGGLVLALHHRKRQVPSVLSVFVHGLVAVSGFGLLWAALWH